MNETSNSELAPLLWKETSRNSKGGLIIDYSMQFGSPVDVGLFVQAACLVAAITHALLASVVAAPVLCGSTLLAKLRLYPGCFQTWNLDGESVFTYLMHYGCFLVLMAECVKCRAEAFLGLMTGSGLPPLVAPYGLLAFMAMVGCCRGEISGFMAEENGCCSWASGGGAGLVKSLRHTQRLEMDAGKADLVRKVGAFETAFLVVLVHCWGAAIVKAFSKMELQAAAAQAAALQIFDFHTLLGASAATACKYVHCKLDSAQQRHRQPWVLGMSPEIFVGRAMHEFLWVSAGLLVFENGWLLD